MNSQIDFIASAKVGDTITARCELVPCTSKKIARYEITMKDQDGKLSRLCMLRAIAGHTLKCKSNICGHFFAFAFNRALSFSIDEGALLNVLVILNSDAIICCVKLRK